eukprot:jgi/Picsp_1/6795/NSC_04134-R1_---NA---
MQRKDLIKQLEDELKPMEKIFETWNEYIKDSILDFEIFSERRRIPSVFGLFIGYANHEGDPIDDALGKRMLTKVLYEMLSKLVGDDACHRYMHHSPMKSQVEVSLLFKGQIQSSSIERLEFSDPVHAIGTADVIRTIAFEQMIRTSGAKYTIVVAMSFEQVEYSDTPIIDIRILGTRATMNRSNKRARPGMKDVTMDFLTKKMNEMDIAEISRSLGFFWRQF